MRLLLDEDSQGRLLVRWLREAGHDVVTVAEAGLESRADAEVFEYARRDMRVLLTRNVRDFQVLHDSQPANSGTLVEHQDRDPAKNMSATDIVRAISNLEASGWDIAGQFVAVNAWSYSMPEHAPESDKR